MTNRKRKGFTIVELVIVIAVIGILAGILIPLFTSLVRDAHIASDELLIRELNNALAIDTAETGKTHETIFDALAATDACGFNVQKINAKASRNRILWDSKNDTFCYLKDEDGETTLVYQNATIKEADKLGKTDYRLWTIQNEVDETYSTYLYNYVGNGVIATAKGIDVSDASNAEITKITYAHEDENHVQSVVIRTNSTDTELVINAQYDTVKHFGYVGNVHVVAVDSINCYEENGKAAFTQVDSGKYKTTATADVELLFVSSAANVNLEIATGTVDHAHAISEEDAGTINGTNPGVVFDYDGNADQAELDVHHHVELEDQVNLTATYETNKSAEVVVAAVDKQAGEEVSKKNEKGANYVARIGAKGYTTFKDAVDSAKTGEKIYLLKDIVVSENIGEVGETGLKNEVILSNDILITFVGNTQIKFSTGGSIKHNGHTLRLTASTEGAGLFLVQITEEINEILEEEHYILTITEDLEFVSTNTLDNYVKFDGTHWKKSSASEMGGNQMISGNDNPFGM